LERGLHKKPRHSKYYLARSETAMFRPGGVVYEAMMLCRAETPANKAKECQPSCHDDLPWPLSVPWSGSFLISSNPTRDLISHGIFADIEEDIVSGYRKGMIASIAEIGQLRDDICGILCFTFGEFQFADGIETPEYHHHPKSAAGIADRMLRKEQLSASYMTYTSQVEDIIKFCGKQSVMLAHPFGDKDSVVVREAFKGFITVSVLQIAELG
jgi:hypothetical protein